MLPLLTKCDIVEVHHYVALNEGTHMSIRPNRTTLIIPRELKHRARIKAVKLDVSLSAVVRQLLGQWVAGEIRIEQEETQEDS